MSIELVVPEVGESIQEVQIGKWLKAEGDAVAADEGIVEIETDKISFEIPAPTAGVIVSIAKKEGEPAVVGDVVGHMEEGEGAPPAPRAEAKPETPAPAPAPVPVPEAAAAAEPRVMPSAQRVLAQAGISAAEVAGTGPGGRVLKEDAKRHLKPSPPPPKPAPSRPSAPPRAPAGGRDEEVVPMSPMRRRIATRLVQAQQTAALLTTFNEVDMSGVIAARKEYGEAFLKKHGVKLGFMSFFVKASVDALKLIPQVNAEIREEEIVYKNHYDIGVAVGGGRGLVVPILRNADRMSFAETEKTIAEYAQRAKQNRLELEELTGGTFTISNGGVYGSMLSTPIVNPPQSGILGLHAIQERPVGVDGQVVLRPMMYVALTYDHRIVDGREAVTFLRRIKDCVESPQRMLLEI